MTPVIIIISQFVVYSRNYIHIIRRIAIVIAAENSIRLCSMDLNYKFILPRLGSPRKAARLT